ncbi:MAG: PorT family protein [Bacteroidales bacterium]|nr:PorT family protein [Bacteroidales bacterium]
MRHEQNDNFDLQVRSMLQDAEVKVPSRVWRAVSSRLDESAVAAASPWGWARWAGLALAVAGALAAALLLPGTFDRRPEAPLVADNTVVTDTPAVVSDAPAVQSEAPAVMPDPIGHPATQRTVPAQEAVPVTEGTVSIQEAVPVTEGTPDQVGSDAIATKDSERSDRGEFEGTLPLNDNHDANVGRQADPFAVMAAEDARKARRAQVSLVAQGSFTGNRSEIGGLQLKPFYGASGTGSPSQIVTEKSASNYGIPVTFGLGARVRFAPRWSVGFGLNYSLLSRSFTGEYQNFYGTVSNTQQYIGVPVNLFFDILSTDVIRFYAQGGGSAEYCIANNFRLDRVETPKLLKEPARGLQFSAGLGLGVEFMLSRRLGVYIDPGVRYYFPGQQPKSVRTDNPLLVTFEAGLRFDLGNR